MPSQFLLDSGVLDTDLLGPVVIVTASANLDGISSSANATVATFATANANLGGLSANADVAPVVPTEAVGTIGSPSYVQPNFPQVTPQEEVEISTIVADALTSLGSLNARAMATVTFSILEDDAEVLLLI